MDKHIIKGHHFWHLGKFRHAKQCYKHAVRRRKATLEDRSISLYMLAYMNAATAIKAHSAMSALGVDLRNEYYDGYLKAGYYLNKIEITDFQPKLYGLPELDPFTLKRIYNTMLQYKTRKMHVTQPASSYLLNIGLYSMPTA